MFLAKIWGSKSHIYENIGMGTDLKIVDYIQMTDDRQGTTSLNDEPSPVATCSHETSSYENCSCYHESWTGAIGTPISQHQQVEKLPFQLLKRTETATHPTVNWYAPVSSTSQLTTQVDFKRMGKPRERTNLTEQQKSVLMDFFDRCQYIKTDDLVKIVDKTGLTTKQVRNWFNNRWAAAKNKYSGST